MAAEEELRQPFLRMGGGQLDALMDRQLMLTKENAMPGRGSGESDAGSAVLRAGIGV
jgi:hypothetical protein